MRQPYRARATSHGHAWMLDLLFSSPAVAWSMTSDLPAGYDRVGRLGVLPAGAGRSFLVSLTSRTAAASALTSYNALRSGRKRAARRVIGLGLRAGLAQPLLHKIDIGVKRDSRARQGEPDLLQEQLAGMFGVPTVSVALGSGTGPYRKPVVQAFSTDGDALGYVKVGWNGWTRDGVRREAEALRACCRSARRFAVPRLLSLSAWQGLDLLVTEPMPRQVRAHPPAAPLPDTAVLRDISSLAVRYVNRLRTSSWWQGVRARAAGCADPVARAVLVQAISRLDEACGGDPVTFGFCHGDFVPWNLAWLGDQLYVWDWETSAPDMPAGFDALHYYFQAAFVGRGMPVADAVSQASQLASPALRELGLPAGENALAGTLHLLEVFLRHEEARRSSGTADDKFYPAVTSVLERQLRQAGAGRAAAIGRVV